MGTERLVIHGAREHNLKNVTLDLPRDELIVFTGLSGSGKSSLAFDTIYAEGQRRYVESLSSYARQFLGQMEKPDVDFIEGLSPAISIDQKSTSRNPRSTVGTITEIYDYLRLLYARIGEPHCPELRAPDRPPDARADRRPGARAARGHPVPGAGARSCGAARASTSKLLDELAGKGFARARIDGEVRDLAEPIRLAKTYKHTIEVVVDRLVAKPDIRRRRHRLGRDGARARRGHRRDRGRQTHEGGEELQTFSQQLACTYDGMSFDELAPRNFSFNSPYGACPTCDGLGTRFEVDPELVVPNPDLSIDEGAIAPWASGHARVLRTACSRRWRRRTASTSTPRGRSCPRRSSEILLYGSDEQDPRPVQEPLRPAALVPHHLRGRDPLRRAPPPGDRVRHPARAARAVHARGPVPSLQGRPPQARDPGRHDRRAQHRRAHRAVDPRHAAPSSTPSSCPSASR